MIKMPSNKKREEVIKPAWILEIEKDIPDAGYIINYMFGGYDNARLTSRKGVRKAPVTAMGRGSKIHKGWDISPLNAMNLRHFVVDDGCFEIGKFKFKLGPYSPSLGFWATSGKMKIAHLSVTTLRNLSGIAREVSVGSTGVSTGLHLHLEASNE